MRNKREYSKTRNSESREEGERSVRRMQLRHWLLVGVGAAGALAKWAISARRDQRQPTRQVDALTGDFLMSPLPPKPPKDRHQVEMPDSATPTNDARTALVTQEADLPTQDEPVENPNLPAGNTFATVARPVSAPPSDLLPVPNTDPRQAVSLPRSLGDDSGRGSKGSTEKNTRGKKMDTPSRKRSKLSQDYDQALEASAVQAGSLPTEDHAGVPLNPALEGKSEATAEPASALDGQTESKLAVGEELRDREFPVPPQETGAASQKLVVDQETMLDEEPPMGGPLGTMPGDDQNSGKVGDIVDQEAKTPDFAQQR